MAEKKSRTNWSDKARRITGGVTLLVIILIILLCVLLGKKNKSAEPEPIVQPVPVATEVKEEKKEEPVAVSKEEPKEEAPVVVEEVKVLETIVEEPVVPVDEEPIKEVIASEEPEYSTGEVSFDVCGITVQNSWSNGLFVSTSNAKERFSKEDVMAFVRYEADKYLSYMDEETVLKIIASTGTIKIEYPSAIDPEILMPYYKNDIEEYAALIAPVEEIVEEPAKEEVVEPVAEEIVPMTADFTVFGYKVLNSWVPGTFTSVSETKGLLYESDVRGFAEYEIGKYGDFLLDNVAIEFVPDGFVLTYPEAVDPSGYIAQYKSDIEEYVAMLFSPVEVVEEPAKEEVVEPVAEEIVPMTADFTVFGYKVLNSWVPGTFTSVSETKGLLYESDVKGFAEYEIGKYGDLLLDNVSIEFVPDGFVLTYPEAVDPSGYIAQYKSDIEEYVAMLFAPVEKVVEEPVVEVVPSVISGYEEFKVMGFVVENTWNDGSYLAETAINGILTEDDIRGFVLYEIAKYGSFLTENVAVMYTADGFLLSIPKDIDPSPYIPVFKSDIEEYIAMLFAPVEEIVEEPVMEEVVEPVVEEPVVPEPVSNIVVSVVTDGVKVALAEEKISPVAEKVTAFDVSLSLGADFGFKTGRSYNPTIFPTFSVAGEFRNMFNLGPIGVGTRFDAAFIFRPLDGTFIGHEFKFFLNGNNWAVDGTLDAKLMFSLDWEKARAYLGIGVGYSLASNVSGITSHIGPQVFGFNSAVVATGVLGVQWKLGDTLFLSLEGQGRYFIQTKEYNFGGAVRIGWSF